MTQGSFHSCTSYLAGDDEVNAVYSILASVNGVQRSYLLSEFLSAHALLNLFMQKKIADFSKLPFNLKNTLEHLNYIRESGASWCTATETAILNLETVKVQVAIPNLDTLIANISAASQVR